MSENSKIEWTHHTFNPWWGCTKVSPACDHCYAERDAKRYGFRVWGNDAERRFFSDKHWEGPLKWNSAAQKLGERHRVFCSSMADIMEDRRDLDPSRLRLYDLIERTPHLDWLLLTKRPQNYRRFFPEAWIAQPQANVWLGTTVESPQYFWRIDALTGLPAVVHFLSIEPLVEAVPSIGKHLSGVEWAITGGESGAGARHSEFDWFRELRDQCSAAGTAFFQKQITRRGRKLPFEEWPEDLQIREFPEVAVATL